MFKRTFYIVFTLPLLIQLISCLPRSSSSDSVDSILPGTTTITPSVGENAVPSGLNSFDEVIRKDLINRIKFELQQTNQIAKDVLADPSMYSIDSEAMQTELSLLRKYVTDSNEALNKVLPADQFDSNTFCLFVNNTEKIVQRLDRYHYIKLDTPEDQVTEDAVKKHSMKFNEEQEKRMDEYILNLVDEFENYVKALSAAEKEKDKDVKDLMPAWSEYKNNELSKRNFGGRLHYTYYGNKMNKWCSGGS